VIFAVPLQQRAHPVTWCLTYLPGHSQHHPRFLWIASSSSG
jgi:hypothetical protein